MPIDWKALTTGVSEESTPEAGEHIALLERAAIVETAKRGEQIVAEWNTGKTKWTSWHAFDDKGMAYTRDFLIALGVDLATLRHEDAALVDALEAKVNRYWRVNVVLNAGTDRVFVNTYVNGPADPIEADVPIDTAGLPDPEPLPGAQFGTKAPF